MTIEPGLARINPLDLVGTPGAEEFMSLLPLFSVLLEKELDVSRPSSYYGWRCGRLITNRPNHCCATLLRLLSISTIWSRLSKGAEMRWFSSWSAH